MSQCRRSRPAAWAAALLLTAVAAHGQPQAPAAPGPAVPVVVDLDLGDDIDDSFALALLLRTPGIDLLGISTAWGDTALRVQMARRLLHETGSKPVPVLQGITTTSSTNFSQARWASGPHGGAAPPPRRPADGDAVGFLLQQARQRPGQITLLALGPLTNLAAALRRDAEGFRQFKQVVLMGGSVRVGYSKHDWQAPRPPDREYNIVSDPAAAQLVFNSGVPIVMMPLDATAVRLDDQRRNAIFSHGSAMTDALTLMYTQWTNAYQAWTSATPTLFDVVPVVWLTQPQHCPLTPLRIQVSDQGDTREVPGAPNARVCLAVNKAGVLDTLMQALLQ